jgi:F-type H+-transporting ATPase subunit gamma
MASLKEVRNRITSVISTQQVTKAMKMVSAAKLRRATDRITQLRPFENRLSAIISNLSAGLGDDVELALSSPNGGQKVLIVVVTSDRGLCGAFNSNITRQVLLLTQTRFASELAAGDVRLLTIGKKGGEFFTRRSFNVIERYQELFHHLDFDHAAVAANYTIDSYLNGTYKEIVLVYNEFKNVATQYVQVEQMLPIIPSEKAAGATVSVDYILEPDAATIVEELIPRMLRTKFYKALLESNASEHGARMTAMDKATENAGDLLKELKITYNRSRQAAITKEILEIVGGAEALGK